MDEVKTFNTWYNEYDRIVYSNILKIVKDPNHVEDILQDVFVALWQNRQLFSSGRSVAGWLVIDSHNKCL